MRNGGSTALDLESLQAVLREHPVQLAILFGSHADGETSPGSDVDIAVAFDGIRSTDRGYNDVFFGLSADLSETLETDDVDLIDLRTTSPQFASAVFENGIHLFGERAQAEALREQLTSTESNEHSPRERIDAALERIDDHLGDGNAAVPATGDAADDG